MEAAADYYAILGVGPEADSGAIRLAYRKLMRLYHPDVNSSDDAAERAIAINAAYGCLGDPDRRAAYDRDRTASPRHDFSPAWTGPSPVRTHWQPSHVYRTEIDRDPLPKAWNRASLGLATALTILTFAATAATPTHVPASPEVVVTVATAAMDQQCAGDDRPADAACPPSAAAPAVAR